jgi:asparagine synthetase B (glutamine-hydrolysing)
MCGIHASISTRGFQTPCRDLEHMLCNRGPDHIGRTQARIDNKNGISYWISLTSTVLALRGGQITAQPFVDSSAGSALCWNGEAWKIGSGPVVGNDGQAVFESLIRASSAQTTASQSVLAIIEVLKSISGPFAFVFLDKHHDQIYFGRDRLGRRSLVYNNDSDSVSMEFASTADPAGGIWKEVEADGIYVLPFSVEETMDELQEREEPADRLLFTSILPVSRHAWESTGVEASVSGPKYSQAIYQ